MNIDRLFAGVWAIKESTLQSLLWLANDYNNLGISTAELRSEREAAVGHAANRTGAVSIIPIHGPISQKASIFHEFFGGASTEGIESMVTSAVNDPNVKAVVLDIDSPGGSVYGVEQAANTIRALRGSKPIVAIANSLAASAAYWIGSQADELYVAPGGEVGSIGVMSAHVDLTKALEQEGVKVTLIKSGKYKNAANPYETLTADARVDLQADCDRYYADFLKGVAAGRGVPASTVRDKYGEGKVFGGEEAVSRGMADRVGTMRDVLTRLGVGKQTGGKRVDLLRKRLEIRRETSGHD